MECKEIVFSGHAIQRMFERGLNENHICQVIIDGEQIAEYPDDKPFPSVLLLGCATDRALHVVLGVDIESQICYVITVYIPDPKLWDLDFRRRST
jgi:hypothetical protein